MASRRRASLAQRDFIHLIFGDENLTLSLCMPIYNQLERDLSDVSRMITDEDLMLQLLSNFDLYASRIAQFFSLLNKNSVNRSIQGIRRKSCVGPGMADELIENFLFPLLGDDFQQFQLRPPFLDLFTSIIDFCLPIGPRPLEALARRLAETGSLLEALVSSESSSGVVKEWVNIFSTTIFDAKIIGVWAGRLVTQCRRCHSNHDVSEQIAIWQKLDDLIGRLTDILQTYPKSNPALPVSGNLRKLTDSDKKSGAAARVQGSGFEVPPAVNDMLQYFRIQPAKSERALKNALEHLEEVETVNVLKAIVGSFPCRPCYEVITSPSAARSYDRFDTDNWGEAAAGAVRDSLLFTELLGRGIGVWRVFVSSQALKDLQQAHVEGTSPFQPIQGTKTG